jgi:hypothetical protein
MPLFIPPASPKPKYHFLLRKPGFRKLISGKRPKLLLVIIVFITVTGLSLKNWNDGDTSTENCRVASSHCLLSMKWIYL